MTTTAYKAFTHDLRSPIQGGSPVWDGQLLYQLPTVEVDSSSSTCGAGWNACREPETALRIAGLWPNGRPVRLFRVETDLEVVERGDKVRAASWEVVKELGLKEPVERFSARYFGDLAAEMAAQQLQWIEALGRPEHNARKVAAALRKARRVRGLDDWTVKRYRTPQAAWAAKATRAARAAWAAGDAWDAWAARDAWDAQAAWDAWDARAARAAWAARDAWYAGAALTVYYAARRGWIDRDPALLTTGLRRAYRYGLETVVPTGPRQLGYCMVANEKQ